MIWVIVGLAIEFLFVFCLAMSASLFLSGFEKIEGIFFNLAIAFLGILVLFNIIWLIFIIIKNGGII